MVAPSIITRSFRSPSIDPETIATQDSGDSRIARHIDAFLARQPHHALSKNGAEKLASLLRDERAVEDRETLSHRGETLTQAVLLLEGFAFRTIKRDEQRAIVGISVPGDFLDLHGFLLGRIDHDVVAAGAGRVACIDHDQFNSLLDESPDLARVLWRSSLLDAAVHRSWIQTLEKHDAPRRIAHIFCELQARLEMTGRANPHAVRTPFTQFDLADMCGVSAVHANRAVGKLREMELADIRRGTFYPGDWEAIRNYARFDPDYLFAVSRTN
ncbi:MAG: Crp/Fnr family transcriptional regulator [Erythrobacter sp.]|jgi:CRP-like cAMP-binding protein|nr:Crp/Fnr family transcriptional regulator [Erythrobacter sp.]